MRDAGAETLDTLEMLDQHLSRLVEKDKRLAPMRDTAGDVALRREPGGFAGMARIINAQMLSVKSAAAIHARFIALMPTPSAQAFTTLSDTEMRAAGLSGAKISALKNLAAAELSGQLDYTALAYKPARAAISDLTAIGGIGRWSAEIYLLFCTGHPDILPSGDLALRKAAHSGLALAAEPTEKQLRDLAAFWSPWRGAAAHLLWRHYAQTRAREGVIG